MPLCACLGGSNKADAMKVQKGDSQTAQGDGSRKSGSFRKRVYVTRSLHEDAIAILEAKFDVEIWQSEHKIPREKLLQDVNGVAAIICTVADEIDDEILDAAGDSLKVIGTMTSGVSNIDEDACIARGILLHHVADLCADVNAEVTVALLLTACKRLIEGYEAVKNGEWGDWKPMWLCGVDLRDKTLGFLGFGRVGYRVAKRLEGFDLARMIYFSLGAQMHGDEGLADRVDDPEEIFRESDFIICCMPLNDSTRGFVNKTNLSLCKPECIFVNTARAEIVDQDDLLDCVEQGIISGAGLDVTTPEPLPPTHALLKNPRIVVTPHMGTATTATRRRMAVHLATTVVDELSM